MPDLTCTCRDCGEDFLFSEGEQAFYAERGFLLAPQKCPDCRRKRRFSTAGKMVWTSVVSTALGVIGSLLSIVLSSAELSRTPGRISTAIGAAIGGVLITAAFTAVLARHKRGTSRVAKLKDELHAAYLGALDRSTLNPQAGEIA